MRAVDGKRTQMRVAEDRRQSMRFPVSIPGMGRGEWVVVGVEGGMG